MEGKRVPLQTCDPMCPFESFDYSRRMTTEMTTINNNTSVMTTSNSNTSIMTTIDNNTSVIINCCHF